MSSGTEEEFPPELIPSQEIKDEVTVPNTLAEIPEPHTNIGSSTDISAMLAQHSREEILADLIEQAHLHDKRTPDQVDFPQGKYQESKRWDVKGAVNSLISKVKAVLPK